VNDALDVMREKDQEDESDALIWAQKWGGVSPQKWRRGKRNWWEEEKRTASYDEGGPKVCEG
jgi:hypothetical protein